jgi:hypothetical protein
MPIKLANNASGTLATAVSASDTGAVLTTGDGAEFPVLTVGDYFYATLTSTAGTQEIVKATARSGDSLTIARAQEGTTAQSFAGGSRVELRVTAQSVIDAINDRVATVDTAAEISIVDAGGYYTGTNVEAALQEAALSTVTQFTPGGTGVYTRSVASRLQEEISVFDFIPPSEHAAIIAGTSTYNCTDAFVAASAYINALDGGKLVTPKGTYTVGKQTFAGATGLGYSYQGSAIIKIENCTKPVVIEFQGVVMKMASGLRYGSFDPVTGAVYNPASMPFVDPDYRADLGVMLFLQNNANVSVIGSVEMDGNSAGMILGGTWGDTGRQIASYGILSYNCDILNVSNVYTHHHCLDGITIGYTGLTETSPLKPTTLINVVSEYNGRQGMSVVGANGLTAIGCKFNNTGRGVIVSAPSAGVDLEAESAVIRNSAFIDCEMVNNTSVGMVADSGDTSGVTFTSCKFIGTTNWAIWPKKPRLVFRDCLMVGSSVNPFTSVTNPDDATKFYNCKFSDEVSLSPTGATYNSGFVVQFDTAPNVLLDGCTIVATQQQACLITQGAYVKNTNLIISAGTTYIGNQGQAASFQSSSIENVMVYDQITSNIPADGIFIYLALTTFTGTNYLSSPSGKVKWFSWSSGAGGATGYLGQNTPEKRPFTGINLSKSQGNDLIGYYGSLLIVSWSAAPTTGTWAVGDRCINSNPVIGQPKSWACTVAGTPGTWVSEGNL